LLILNSDSQTKNVLQLESPGLEFCLPGIGEIIICCFLLKIFLLRDWRKRGTEGYSNKNFKKKKKAFYVMRVHEQEMQQL
jgi:hypothetical protein